MTKQCDWNFSSMINCDWCPKTVSGRYFEEEGNLIITNKEEQPQTRIKFSYGTMCKLANEIRDKIAWNVHEN